MTTKKIIIIVAAVVLVLGLIVVIVAGGIVGGVLYGIGNSEAANVSRDFLRHSERLKDDIGEVKDFGKVVTGNIQVNSGSGNAELNIKVIGERKEVNATVELVFRGGQQWRVVSAAYQNEAGETINLQSPFESRKFPPRLVVSLFELTSVHPPCSLCLRGESLLAIAHDRDAARLTPQPNDALAPAEPNVYRPGHELTTALQRSAMFPVMDSRIIKISLLWSEEESFSGCEFYKHYVPPGREPVRKPCQENKKLLVCCTENTEPAQRKLKLGHYYQAAA
jgi:hypothetical protein